MTTTPGSGWPSGTVYGCLLNFRREWAQLADRMTQPPHKAAPQAPVLYIKTANTWSASGSAIALPTGADAVQIGASVALVIGPRQWQAGAARTQTGLHTVRAPYASVVSEVPVQLGDMAMPGRPLFTLYDPTSLRVSAALPQTPPTLTKHLRSL